MDTPLGSSHPSHELHELHGAHDLRLVKELLWDVIADNLNPAEKDEVSVRHTLLFCRSMAVACMHGLKL